MASEREFRAGERFLATVQIGLVPELNQFDERQVGVNICFNCYDETGRYYNLVNLPEGNSIRQYVGKRISYVFYEGDFGPCQLPLRKGIKLMYDYLISSMRKKHVVDSRPIRWFELGIITVCEALSMEKANRSMFE